MSWAEDNDIDWGGFDDMVEVDREEEWEEGFHTTADGEEIPLKKMTDFHLKNTIKYFEKTRDVSALLAEQERRIKLTMKKKNVG